MADQVKDRDLQDEEEEPRLMKNLDELERHARRNKLDGMHVKYLTENVASERGFRILADNEERFGPLETPEEYDLRRNPEAREAKIQELRRQQEEIQRQLNTLGEEAVHDQVAGQAPLNPDGSVADLGERQDDYAVREARYKSMTAEQLRTEIENRNNDGRDDGDKMNLSGNKPDLVNRLLEDDEWQAELDEDDEQ